jgi:hypothetical protein
MLSLSKHLPDRGNTPVQGGLPAARPVMLSLPKHLSDRGNTPARAALPRSHTDLMRPAKNLLSRPIRSQTGRRLLGSEVITTE